MVEPASYVECRKAFVRRRPKTTYCITPSGWRALTGSLNAMQRLIDAIGSPVQLRAVFGAVSGNSHPHGWVYTGRKLGFISEILDELEGHLPKINGRHRSVPAGVIAQS